MMNIDLPRKNLRTKFFIVQDGMLFLKSRFLFKQSIQEITYILKGRRKCYYCGLDYPESEMTLDHVYPKDLGGPYIPNNLVPCCQVCNGMKSNLKAGEFFEFTQIPTTEGKLKFVKELTKQREKLRKVGKSELPRNWVEEIPTKKIRFHTIEIKEKSWNKKQKIFLACNGHIPTPIVVDRDLMLIDGFQWLIIARQYNLKTVKVIKLDNVVILKSRKFKDLLERE